MQEKLFKQLVKVISETNGISLQNTLELAIRSEYLSQDKKIKKEFADFIKVLGKYKNSECEMEELLEHPVAKALYDFFKYFPIRYREEHTHLSGSLQPEFVYHKLEKKLEGPHGSKYEDMIREVYGDLSVPIRDVEDVRRLLIVNEDEAFERYLEKLYLTKLILTDQEAHRQAAYSLAQDMYDNYNVGSVRMKFTFSRDAKMEAENLLGKNATSAEAMLGLYQGFKDWQQEHRDFKFYLSPSFRKEGNFFNAEKFSSKQEDFMWQVNELLVILNEHPELAAHVTDVDTVGNEMELYQKRHFKIMQYGFRKLQQHGLKIRSHHGEVWHTLGKGIQAVDNAMNIWRIDTLEHGLSLGINPNYYFHSLFERILLTNRSGKPIDEFDVEGKELKDMDWSHHEYIYNKLIAGETLDDAEIYKFTKIKYFTALEVEHYQHDVLNRMIDKGVSLTSIPTSNLRLTSHIPDFKDHPFSWWEKKNLSQSIGTDNYVTLQTDFIREMLILLFSDSRGLKITKLLMIATGENRRPYLSSQLWNMRKKYVS